MRVIIRIVSVVLCICMMVTFFPVQNVSAESSTERYEDKVVNNYIDSFASSSYYYQMTDLEAYYYKIWARNIDEKGVLTKGFLWLCNTLMDTKLDTLAFTNYLAKLLSMVEGSYMEALANQANQTENITLKEVGKDIAGNALEMFFESTKFKELSIAYSAMELTDKLVDIADELGDNATAFHAISIADTMHTKKMTILQAIYDNTDNKYLQEAAQIKMKECDLSLIYIANECLTDIVTAVASAENDIFDLGLDIVENITKKVATGLGPYVKALCESPIGKKILGEGFEKTASYMLSSLAANANLVSVGVDIGVAVSKLLMGNEYEMTREAMAMSEISDALSKELKTLKSEADSTGDYETVVKYVYIAGALPYVHLRGEYCDMKCRSGKEKEIAERQYNSKTLMLAKCADIIESILKVQESVLNEDFELYNGFVKEVDQLTEVPEGYVGIYSFTDFNVIAENSANTVEEVERGKEKNEYNSAKYILMNDISFPDQYETSYYFFGVLDGNGYKMSNVSKPLFTSLTSAQIRNLSIEVSATNYDDKIGEYGNYGAIAKTSSSSYERLDDIGHVGTIYTKIDNCSISGNIIINGDLDGNKRTISGCFGSLIGDGAAKITNCYSDTDIMMNVYSGYVGGFCGSHVDGIIENCYNIGSIKSQQVYSYDDEYSGELNYNSFGCGGITGKACDLVKNCYNKGNISAIIENGGACHAGAGGIVGEGSHSDCYSIENCANSGDVSLEWVKDYDKTEDYGPFIYCSSFAAGGILGAAQSGGLHDMNDISNCSNTGDIYGELFSGGIVGFRCIDDYTHPLNNCYNTGSITGELFAGGIVGAFNNFYNEYNAVIENVINTGTVTADTCGAIVSTIDDADENLAGCYYLEGELGPTSLGTNYSGTTAITEEALADFATFVEFDFTYIWIFKKDATMPTLRYEKLSFDED